MCVLYLHCVQKKKRAPSFRLFLYLSGTDSSEYLTFSFCLLSSVAAHVTFTWLHTALECLKLLSHSEHLYGLFPVWTLSWLFSFPDSRNVMSHTRIRCICKIFVHSGDTARTLWSTSDCCNVTVVQITTRSQIFHWLSLQSINGVVYIYRCASVSCTVSIGLVSCGVLWFSCTRRHNSNAIRSLYLL